MRYHIIYRAADACETGFLRAQKLDTRIPRGETVYHELDSIRDYREFIAGLTVNEVIIVSGNDSTLSAFVNRIYPIETERGIYYYRSFYGRDFKDDVREDNNKPVVKLNGYLEYLPSVTVNGMRRFFINGIGFGADAQGLAKAIKRVDPKETPDFTEYSARNALFCFKPVKAVITVDGKESVIDKVRMAPVLFGSRYNYGLLAAPEQKRLNPDRTVTLAVMHGCSGLRAYSEISSMGEPEYTPYSKIWSVFTGREITVRFDRPAMLQIDGEIIGEVSEYKVNTI